MLFSVFFFFFDNTNDHIYLVCNYLTRLNLRSEIHVLSPCIDSSSVFNQFYIFISFKGYKICPDKIVAYLFIYVIVFNYNFRCNILYIAKKL